MATSDRCRTKSEVRWWIQVGMVMQDAVDSAEIDMSTATRKSWYIEAGMSLIDNRKLFNRLMETGFQIVISDPANGQYCYYNYDTTYADSTVCHIQCSVLDRSLPGASSAFHRTSSGH